MFIEEFFIDVDVNNIVDITSTEKEKKKDEMMAYMIKCIDDLTIIQKRRLYKYYYLGLTKTIIAKDEGVSEGSIRKSINQSVYQLRRKMYTYIR